MFCLLCIHFKTADLVRSVLDVSRYQDRVDLGWEFSQTLICKLAAAVTPLGVSPPESVDTKLVYIMGNTTCEPKPGNARSPDPSVWLSQGRGTLTLMACILEACHAHPAKYATQLQLDL